MPGFVPDLPPSSSSSSVSDVAVGDGTAVLLEETAAENRCRFWLPNKRRFCANNPLPSSKFCGNHDPAAGARRISCPIDPSHSVSEDNLESHMKRCPLRKRTQDLESQPYYSKGINSGCNSADEANVDSAAKRSAIFKLSVTEFFDLLNKIKSIHSAISMELPDSYTMPDACNKWLKQQLGRKLPYQEKHVLQQASIIGNMEAFGILRLPVGKECEQNDDFGMDEVDTPVVVEFGAGRGYLTQMLTDSYGIRKVCLIERRSYKLKADRSLRQSEGITLERLRIDIEDLNLNEVNLLNGLPYLAIGKHLCGPATDLTLTCCLNGEYNRKKKDSNNCHLQGLALATCCHHLCQWKYYANKKFLLHLGITEEEFHAMTWFTSWAVDADHGSALSEILHQGLNLHTREKKDLRLEEGKGVEEGIRIMPAPDRALLGFMCKEIIDMGRLQWLRDQGISAQLVKYVPSNISPENHLLLAKI